MQLYVGIAADGTNENVKSREDLTQKTSTFLPAQLLHHCSDCVSNSTTSFSM